MSCRARGSTDTSDYESGASEQGDQKHSAGSSAIERGQDRGINHGEGRTRARSPGRNPFYFGVQ